MFYSHLRLCDIPLETQLDFCFGQYDIVMPDCKMSAFNVLVAEEKDLGSVAKNYGAELHDFNLTICVFKVNFNSLRLRRLLSFSSSKILQSDSVRCKLGTSKFTTQSKMIGIN